MRRPPESQASSRSSNSSFAEHSSASRASSRKQTSLFAANGSATNSASLYSESKSSAEAPSYLSTSESYLYFAYGKNMWSEEMLQIVSPRAQYYGVAYLEGWRWIVTTGSRPNIVELTEEDKKTAKTLMHTRVYGVVWQVPGSDEGRVAQSEAWQLGDRVSTEPLPVHYIQKDDPDDPVETQVVHMYIDYSRRRDMKIARTDLTFGINQAIAEMLATGISKPHTDYFNHHLRRVIKPWSPDMQLHYYHGWEARKNERRGELDIDGRSAFSHVPEILLKQPPHELPSPRVRQRYLELWETQRFVHPPTPPPRNERTQSSGGSERTSSVAGSEGTQSERRPESTRPGGKSGGSQYPGTQWIRILNGSERAHSSAGSRRTHSSAGLEKMHASEGSETTPSSAGSETTPSSEASEKTPSSAGSERTRIPAGSERSRYAGRPEWARLSNPPAAVDEHVKTQLVNKVANQEGVTIHNTFVVMQDGARGPAQKLNSSTPKPKTRSPAARTERTARTPVEPPSPSKSAAKKSPVKSYKKVALTRPNLEEYLEMAEEADAKARTSKVVPAHINRVLAEEHKQNRAALRKHKKAASKSHKTAAGSEAETMLHEEHSEDMSDDEVAQVRFRDWAEGGMPGVLRKVFR